MLCMIVDKEIMRKDSKESATILRILQLSPCRCGPVFASCSASIRKNEQT
jgi:hypothetical protein